MLRDDFSRLPFELYQFLQEHQSHVALWRQLLRRRLYLCLHEHHVLEEVAQQVDKRPVVLRMELLEDRDEANDEMRAVDLGRVLVFAHHAAEVGVVAHVAEGMQSEDGEEVRHGV